MSIKLSELLGEAVLSMHDVSEEANENEQHKLSERYMQQAKALRAIAPALVEIAQASYTLNKTHGYLAFQGDPHKCPACRLVCAMKEAGVTCE